jgi:hypothetical protein
VTFRRHFCGILVACAVALASSVVFAADPTKISTPVPRIKGETPYEQKYYADPFYAEIDVAAEDNKPARDVIAFLELKVQDKPERINAASLWLRDNSVGQRDITKVNSLYFLAYSDFTLQLAQAYRKAKIHDAWISMLKTSVMALYIYEMTATMDAMRCADPTVLSAMREDTLIPRYGKLNEAYEILSKSDFDFFESEAYIAEKKFERRRPNEFICSLGAAKLADMLRQEGVQTFRAPNPASGRESMRVIPPQGYTFMPSFVVDTEWAKRRESMKKQLQKIWDDRYKRLSKGDVATGNTRP